MDINFFKNHKILFTAYCSGIIFLIFVSILFYKHLLFDFPSICFAVLDFEQRGNILAWDIVSLNNNFTNILLSLPYNFLSLIFPDTPLTKANILAFSYYSMTFLAMFANYLIAKRTKRFDIAVFAFAFYALGYIPNSVFFYNPVYFYIQMQFIFLQYFLTNERLWKRDFIYIALFSLYLFESSSFVAIISLALFLFSLLYIKRKIDSRKIKLLLGGFSLIIFVYSLIKNIIHADLLNLYLESWNSISLNFLSHTPNIIIFSAAAIFIYSILKDKLFEKIDFIFISLVVAISAILVYIFSRYMPQVYLDMHSYILAMIALLLIISFVVIVDFFQLNFDKEKFYNNLFIIVCIFGLINIFHQVYFCKFSYEYNFLLKEKLASNNGLIYVSENDRKRISFKLYNDENSIIKNSLLFLPKGTVSSLIVTENERTDGRDKQLFYDLENEHLDIQWVTLPIYGKYYDFSEILPLIEEHNKE